MSSEKNTPLLSIIMAVYNGAAVLPKTLESLLNQRFKNFELVVVNDESKDNSEQILRDFAEKNREISFQYHFQKNKGLGGARNTAMRHAKGEIFCLLDQDDIWYPAKLEKIAGTFEKQPDISFLTHHLYRRVQGNITEEIRCRFVMDDLFHQLLFRENYFCGSAMSFRKTVTDKIGFFSEERGALHLTEDYDYWLRAAGLELKFLVLEEILGEYVVHNSNFSKNRRMMLRNEWQVVLKHFHERLTRRPLDPLYLMKRRGTIFVRQALTFLSL